MHNMTYRVQSYLLLIYITFGIRLLFGIDATSGYCPPLANVRQWKFALVTLFDWYAATLVFE